MDLFFARKFEECEEEWVRGGARRLCCMACTEPDELCFGATKQTWRGEYARVIRVSKAAFSTHVPGDNKETHHHALSDVLTVSQVGRQIEIELASPCSCGLCRTTMSFALPSAGRAECLRSALLGSLRPPKLTSDEELARRAELRSQYAQQGSPLKRRVQRPALHADLER